MCFGVDLKIPIDQALKRALEAHREGKIDDAEKLYKAILSTYPMHADANHNLGVIQISKKKYHKAVGYFEKAVQENSSFDQFWISLVEALLLIDRFDLAKEALARASEFKIDTKKFRELGDRVLKRSQRNDESLSLAKVLIQRFQNGEFAEAERLARSFTTQYPKQHLGWTVLGGVMKGIGKLSDSLTYCERAAEVEPTDPNVQSNLGTVLRELGKLGEASKRFRLALELDPGEASRHADLASSLEANGELEEAREHYEHALKISPDYVEALGNIAVLLQRQRKFIDAEARYLRALTIKPDYILVRFNYGILLEELERFGEAEAEFKKILSQQANHFEALLKLGSLSQKLGKISQAETHFKEAVKLNSSSLIAYARLGSLHKEFGRLEEAKFCYGKAIEIDSNFTAGHNNIAVIYQELGMLDDALEHYRVAEKLGGYRSEVLKGIGRVLLAKGLHKEGLAYSRRASGSVIFNLKHGIDFKKAEAE